MTGQVEFCLYGDWGAVCAHNTLNKFDTQASQVVCYELGYSGQGANYGNQGPNTVSNGFVWLGHVKCQGYEEKLNDCTKEIYNKIPQGCKSSPAFVYVTCPSEYLLSCSPFRAE